MHKALELDDIPRGAAVAIYGSGGLGRSVLDILRRHRPDVSVPCFLDTNRTDTDGDIPCWKFAEAPSEALRGLRMIVIASTFRYEILSHVKSLSNGTYGVPVRFVHPRFPFGLDADGYSRDILRRWEARGMRPEVMAVTFSTACNFRCTMCMAAKRGMLRKNFLDERTFERVIEEYHRAGLQKIGLNGHGESLLHPEFLPMVRRAHEAGLKMSLITNGSLLDEEKILELHAMGVHIALSFAGWDKQSYESQYVGGRFEHSHALIRFMAGNLPPQAFTIKACVLDDDSEHPGRIAEFFASCGLDLMSYRIAEASSQGGALAFGGYCQAKDMHSFKAGLERKRQPLCQRLLNSWMVLPDGKVTACGCGPAIQQFVIGDIREQGLEEMGRSELLHKVVRSFMDEDARPMGACARCEKPFHPSFIQPMDDVVC